jgi:hypothetical protein
MGGPTGWAGLPGRKQPEWPGWPERPEPPGLIVMGMPAPNRLLGEDNEQAPASK